MGSVKASCLERCAKRIKSAGLIAMRSVAPNTSTKVLVTKLGGCGPARLGKRNADLVAMDREAMRCIRDRAPMTPYRLLPVWYIPPECFDSGRDIPGMVYFGLLPICTGK